MLQRPLRFLGVLLALLLRATTALGAEPLRLELDPTAASLSEGEIRLAVEKELRRPVTGPDPALPSDVRVAVADGQIVIRVRQGNNVIERSVPLPSNLADVPLTVSLIVGNLARDQSVGLGAPAPAPSAAPAPAPASPPPPRPSPAPFIRPELPDTQRAAPRPKRPVPSHWVGVHLAQDLASVGGNNLCDSNLGQKTANYACFYEGTTDQPFVHTPYPYRDSIQSGLVAATQRVLFSYDHAFIPSFTLGAAAGYAFGGGPPAGQTVTKVDGAVPERARGTGGTPFFPLHLELRAAYFFLPLTNRILRAYVRGSAGAAQVDAKVSIPEYDCTKAGSPDLLAGEPNQSLDWTNPSNGRVYTPPDQCRYGVGYYNYRYYKPVKVDAWKKMGQVFLSLGAGSMLAVTDQLGVVLNLNVMAMLPASGLVLQPSLGVEYGF